MRKTLLSTLLLGALAGFPGMVGLAAAEDAKPSAKSPYQGGPPPVTDGYADTSQGGTKTSGDAPIPPPSKDGKVELLERGPDEKLPSAVPSPAAKPPAGS